MASDVQPHDYGPDLLPQHAALLAASTIAPAVAAARGYRSIHKAIDLADLGFTLPQCRAPGLLVPIYDASGRQASYQYRPDAPRNNGEGKPIKYETPGGSRMVLDVPPGARAALGDPRRPLWITEGARKADAAVSAGLCCVALLGVWNFRGTNASGGKTALGDWEAVALNDRPVYIAFDSDVTTKPAVQGALLRLAAFLTSRGARVQVVQLPAAPDGGKVGLDDFLAAQRTTDAFPGAALLDLAQAAAAPAPSSVLSPPSSALDRAPSQATQLVDLAHAAGLALFHTPDGAAYATLPAPVRDGVGAHQETWALRGRPFRFWLAGQYYAARRAAPAASALQDALGVLEGEALYSGPEEPVYLRVARAGDALYLDLADDAWQAVRITADGWALDAAPPVRFRRVKGMLPLPVPVRGGALAGLWPFVNVADARGRALLAAFLVAALRPEGPYPLLLLAGEQGSAKSTLARLLRSLIDPTASLLRAEPASARDLMIGATNNWLLALDNLSHLPAWLSDALCRLSTGGGFATRELYTDGEEAIFSAQRPVILTSIEEIATRGDLLERALVLTLDPIPDEARQPERALWAAFEAARPAILGALLDGVAAALGGEPAAARGPLPRLADFALWAGAAERGLGLPPGSMAAAYERQVRAADDVALDASPLTMPLGALLADAPDHAWQGTAAVLLDDLNRHLGDGPRPRGWPASPALLSGALRRLAPVLRRRRIELVLGTREGDQGRRIIRIRKVSHAG